MASERSSSSGVGFVGLLTVAFVVLKLTGHIGWSWWWVISPVWISTGVLLAIALIALAVWGVCKVVSR